MDSDGFEIGRISSDTADRMAAATHTWMVSQATLFQVGMIQSVCTGYPLVLLVRREKNTANQYRQFTISMLKFRIWKRQENDWIQGEREKYTFQEGRDEDNWDSEGNWETILASEWAVCQTREKEGAGSNWERTVHMRALNLKHRLRWMNPWTVQIDRYPASLSLSQPSSVYASSYKEPGTLTFVSLSANCAAS